MSILPPTAMKTFLLPSTKYNCYLYVHFFFLYVHFYNALSTTCLENRMNSMKRQKDWTLKEILWIPLFKITLHWIPHLFPALPIHSSDPNSEPECPPSDCSPLPITWQTPTSDQSLSSLLLIWLPYYFSSLTGFFWSCCLSPDPHPFFPDLLQ